MRASGAGHSFTPIALTDGVMIRCDRLDRVLAVDRDRGPGQGRGRDRPARPQPAPRRARASAREPRRHRSPDARRGDLDRHPRHRRAPAQHLGPDRGGRARARRRRLASRSAPTIPRPWPRRGSASGRSGSSTRRRSGSCPRSRWRASTARGRSTRRSRASMSSTPTATTSSSTSSRTPRRRSAARRAAPTGRRSHARAPPSTRRRSRSRTGSGSCSPSVARRFPKQIPRLSRVAAAGTGRATKVDRSFRVFASERRIKFTEMEYGIPREHAAEAVRARARTSRRVPSTGSRSRSRSASPPATTSPSAAAHARDVCYVAVHQDRRLDWEPYFRGVEEIMDSYGGPPALGQAPLPDGGDAGAAVSAVGRLPAVRARLDPEGVFSNAYVDRVLGQLATSS